LTGERIRNENRDKPCKQDRLRAHQIGLRDTVAACEREGSLDAVVRQAQANEFGDLLRRCPHLFRVCFNGKTSGKSGQRLNAAGFETLVLPSSSPACAQMSFDDKLAVWKRIGDPKRQQRGSGIGQRRRARPGCRARR
jgi:hypoxanthine-DNA glycosylase